MKKNTKNNKKITLLYLIPAVVVVVAAAIIIPLITCSSRIDLSTLDKNKFKKDIDGQYSIERGIYGTEANHYEQLTNLFHKDNTGYINYYDGMDFQWYNFKFSDSRDEFYADLTLAGGHSSKYKGALDIGTIHFENKRVDISTIDFISNLGDFSDATNDHFPTNLTQTFKDINGNLVDNWKNFEFNVIYSHQPSLLEQTATISISCNNLCIGYFGTKTMPVTFDYIKTNSADIFTYDRDNPGIITGLKTPYVSLSSINTMVIPDCNPNDPYSAPITQIGTPDSPFQFFGYNDPLHNTYDNITTLVLGDNLQKVYGDDIFSGFKNLQHLQIGKSLSSDENNGGLNLNFLKGKQGAYAPVGEPLSSLAQADHRRIKLITVNLDTTTTEHNHFALVDEEGNIQTTESMTVGGGMLCDYSTIMEETTAFRKGMLKFAWGNVTIPEKFEQTPSSGQNVQYAHQGAFDAMALTNSSQNYVSPPFIDRLSFGYGQFTIAGNWDFANNYIGAIDFTNVIKVSNTTANCGFEFFNVAGLTELDFGGFRSSPLAVNGLANFSWDRGFEKIATTRIRYSLGNINVVESNSSFDDFNFSFGGRTNAGAGGSNAAPTDAARQSYSHLQVIEADYEATPTYQWGSSIGTTFAWWAPGQVINHGQNFTSAQLLQYLQSKCLLPSGWIVG